MNEDLRARGEQLLAEGREIARRIERISITMDPEPWTTQRIIAALSDGVSCFCTPHAYIVDGAYPSQLEPGQINVALQPEDRSEMLRVRVAQSQRDTWFKDGKRYRVFLIEEESHEPT